MALKIAKDRKENNYEQNICSAKNRMKYIFLIYTKIVLKLTKFKLLNNLNFLITLKHFH